MPKIKIISTVALTLSLVLVVGVSGPVLAHPGHEGEHKTASTDSMQAQAARREAKLAAQTERTAKTAEQKQANCQTRKQGLTNKFGRITTNSERITKHIDDILAKGQAYQQANNLQPAGYAELVAAAEAAGTAADDAIANLKSVTPSLDCNNTSVASDVAAFKAAAQETRDSLKDYRKAVKAVLKSLLDAKKAANTEGSDD